MNNDLLRKTFDRIVKIVNAVYRPNAQLFKIIIHNNKIWYQIDDNIYLWLNESKENNFDLDALKYQFLMSNDLMTNFLIMITIHISGQEKEFIDTYQKLATIGKCQSLEEINIKLDLLGL